MGTMRLPKKGEPTFRAWVRTYAQRHDMTMTEFGEQIGLPIARLSDLCLGKLSMNDGTLTKIRAISNNTKEPYLKILRLAILARHRFLKDEDEHLRGLVSDLNKRIRKRR